MPSQDELPNLIQRLMVFSKDRNIKMTSLTMEEGAIGDFYKEIPFKIALQYWFLQKLPETAEYYGKAIAIDPEYLQAHLNLASVYERMKLWDKALKEVAISLHLAKKNQDEHTVSVANNKLTLFKGRMNMTEEDYLRKTQPPFE